MRFDMICEANGIEHRLTKLNHPWSLEDQKTVQWTVFPTNGQVERMNGTIEDATVKRFHYETHDQLRTHRGGPARCASLAAWLRWIWFVSTPPVSP